MAGAPLKCREHRAAVFLLLLQIVIIVLYGIFISYGRDADPKAIKAKSTHLSYYGMFQDVHVMLLVGFGFLMTFLRKYGFGSVGFNFLLSAIMIQWGLLALAIFEGPTITVLNLVKTDILVASILISFGAVLGKATPSQLVLMGLVEAPVYALNTYIGELCKVSDPGGSIYVHLFGAYFGLAVSRILGKVKPSALEASSYQSDLFAMIGTLFLWVFWPSFNGVLSTEDDQQRAVINTYLALTASCLAAFAFSSLLNPSRRFTMAHIQNATLAGGVGVGAVAEHMIQPFGALIIGFKAGIISTYGFARIQSWLEKKIGLHDTCGVHNLHGLPAISSAFTSAFVALIATQATYGARLFIIYKARAPLAFSPELKELQHNLIQVLPGEGRTALEQAGFQLLGAGISLALALAAGTLTGLLLKAWGRYMDSVPAESHHDDQLFWELPEECAASPHQSSNTLNVA